jgi:hypothetical protein
MAKVASCPSCGAPVEFKSVVSVLAVCDYCQSTLLRKGEEFENLGKMAELVADRSPLQRGAEGRWDGVHFALIGRIQLRYAQGLWNEWHLLFDDGRSGWLSEAGGEYVLSLPQPPKAALPGFDAIRVGEWLTLDGRTFTVANKLSAECVAGEGELPFKVGAGYAAPVVDLRDEAGGFATLDYSDDPARPVVFVGRSVEFSSLGWANLRADIPLPQANVQVRAFNCPNCGAPRKVEHADIVTVGCTGCGALLDTSSSDEVRLIERVAAQIKLPRLPLGSKGTLRGEPVELIGFMRRATRIEGVEYAWDEYLCLGRDNRLIWLTEYAGHWNIARVLQRSIDTTKGDLRFEGERFKHFQTYPAHVRYVLGEFPWRVRIDETVKVADYVAPPQMLSWESGADEVTWTLAEYAEPLEIALAFEFAQALPEPQGVFANQPNPHAISHRSVCRRFWAFLFAGLAIYVAMLFLSPGGELLRESLVFDADDDEPQLSREFRLAAPTGRLEVRHDTNLDNNWLALDLTLLNKDTGEAWQAQRELSRYAGVEDGEHWTEGSGSDAVVFADLPAGTYVLAADAEIGTDKPGKPLAGAMVPDFSSPQSLAAGKMVPLTGERLAPPRPVRTQLTVSQPGPRGSSFALLAIFLALFPIFTRLRLWNFEVARWAESDHPMVTADEGGDD